MRVEARAGVKAKLRLHRMGDGAGADESDQASGEFWRLRAGG